MLWSYQGMIIQIELWLTRHEKGVKAVEWFFTVTLGTCAGTGYRWSDEMDGGRWYLDYDDDDGGDWMMIVVILLLINFMAVRGFWFASSSFSVRGDLLAKCANSQLDHDALPPKSGWVWFGKHLQVGGIWEVVFGGRWGPQWAHPPVGACGKIRQIRGRALTDWGAAPPHNLHVADLGRWVEKGNQMASSLMLHRNEEKNCILRNRVKALIEASLPSLLWIEASEEEIVENYISSFHCCPHCTWRWTHEEGLIGF